jgi:hypothetical protein
MKSIQSPSSAWQMKVFPFFSVLGWILIVVSLGIGAFVLTPTAVDYWAGNAKAVRDAAESGSVLLAQLGTLQTIPRWLEPLAFVGVAAFMMGIALQFSSIPALLENRGKVMSACFPSIVKQ